MRRRRARGGLVENSNTDIVAVASIYHGCHGAACVTSASRFDTHRASALVYDDEIITMRDSSWKAFAGSKGKRRAKFLPEEAHSIKKYMALLE